MNVSFLVLVAIPLGAYLLILLFSTSRLGADEKQENEAHLLATDERGEEISREASVAAAGTEAPTGALPETAFPDNIGARAEELTSTETQSPVVQLTEASVSFDDLSTGEQVDELPAVAVTAAAHSEEQTGTAPSQHEEVEVGEPMPQAEPAAPLASVSAAPTELDAAESKETAEPLPVSPEGPVVFPSKGTPKYAFDYRGRLWVEKKQKSFFRQLRRPLLPPEDPPSNSGR